MAILENLPLEIHSLILTNLNVFEVEDVARTFNRRLFASCTVILAESRPWLLNARRMLAVFPAPSPLPGNGSLNHKARSTLLQPTFPGHVQPFSVSCWTATQELGPRYYSCVIAVAPEPRSSPNSPQPENSSPSSTGSGSSFENCSDNDYTTYELRAAAEALGPWLASAPPDLHSWMTLDGSLDWLAEPSLENAEIPYEVAEHQPAMDPTRVATLTEQVAEVPGLALPPGFANFMASTELAMRMPSAHFWHFELGRETWQPSLPPSPESPVPESQGNESSRQNKDDAATENEVRLLIKAPWRADAGAGGYIVMFHADGQGCAFAYLYLDTRGGHCVLLSGEDFYDDDEDKDGEEHDSDVQLETDPSRAAAVPHTKQRTTHLAALSFEEYLAAVYYQELMYFNAPDSAPGVAEYIRGVFRPMSELRAMQELYPEIRQYVEHWDALEPEEGSV